MLGWIALLLWLVVTFVPAPAQRWSDAATWGGRVPHAGDDVTIARGQRVVLDVDPQRLGKLVVDGELIAGDRDLRLEAGSITVRGRFAIASPERRFAHRARIVLDASGPHRGILSATQGGRIDLFGRRIRTWTHLAHTAEAGSQTIDLADETRWNAGDRIALAPSGFDAREAEEATIAAVSGAHVTLRARLRFSHYGAITDGVDERAEVGLLSHDIVIESDLKATQRRTGAQVVALEGGSLRVAGVDFAHLGRAATLGAYPIHFHLARDASGSYVEDSSIEHSFNRCLAIHGTSGVRASRNVAFDTVGHCYFLEDGIETANVLDDDLAILVRAPDPKRAVLDTDLRPAAFWIANPANVLTGDVAAGTDGVGFWYDLPLHPGGPSRDAHVFPRRVALGTFANDVAHTNEHDGLFVDNLRNPPGVSEAPNYTPAQRAEFAAFTAYKNRRHGAWLRGTNLRVANARLADNAIGVTFAGDADVLEAALVVGESANASGPPKPAEPAFPIRGFEFYDGTVGVRDTRFVNFAPTRERAASALAALRFSPFFTSPRNFASGLSFENALPVYLEPQTRAERDALGGDGYRSNVFVDEDGSVGGRAGAAIVIDSPLLVDADCTRHPLWHVAVCPPQFGSLFVSDLDEHPAANGPLRIARLGTPDPGIILLRGNPRDRFATSFEANVRTNQRYAVRFLAAFPHHVRVSLRNTTSDAKTAVAFANAPEGAVAYVAGDRSRAIGRTNGRMVVRLGSDATSAFADVCARADCR